MRAARGHHRAAVAAHAAPRVCHAPAQPRCRPARGAAAAGPCRHLHHHYLYPCGARAAQAAACAAPSARVASPLCPRTTPAMSVFSRRLALLCAAACAAAPWPVFAQADWPARPIRIVVAYPAGGVSDVVARALGEKLAQRLGTPVVVENKAGAGGTIGMDAVAKAAPDR